LDPAHRPSTRGPAGSKPSALRVALRRTSARGTWVGRGVAAAAARRGGAVQPVHACTPGRRGLRVRHVANSGIFNVPVMQRQQSGSGAARGRDTSRDWTCPQCNNLNWGNRDKCNRCPQLRPPRAAVGGAAPAGGGFERHRPPPRQGMSRQVSGGPPPKRRLEGADGPMGYSSGGGGGGAVDRELRELRDEVAVRATTTTAAVITAATTMPTISSSQRAVGRL
jgi:membrane protease subunit (stomatin/prohibitin family)